MKRPVSLFLLFAFLVIQLYVAKIPEAHQVQTTSWLAVSSEPGGLVSRNGDYYLVTPSSSFQLQSNGISITSRASGLNWVEVPEPSGAGIWRMALTAQGVPLVGIGGAIYPAPNATGTLWIDSGDHRLYYSQPPLSGMQSVGTTLSHVKKVVWAPDAQSAAVLAQGPEGWGIYVWTHANQTYPALILRGGQQQIANYGILRNQTVIAALKNGHILQQGHGLVSIPPMEQVRVSRQYASALGHTATQAIFWSNGKWNAYPLPKQLKWVGVPRFSKNGTMAATLAQNLQGTWHLLLYGHHYTLDVHMPFTDVSEYHLLGFMGDHWILITVPEGPHRGTYAWWINH
ncbi:MAG: hypothetical protein C7B47_15155 [Sulfobacillus thermosulfidooxidans]|uniref:Uncharacterized protein n=1 Tax=Sulfobacillus thermosulfidooxidans TaxID=28034 RepID=A0A2T2WPV8_SULTH|nr:MAG: hypothetical protein C7B47_15155 [Sulfobacillus thermosulfidooxidans]